MAAELACLSTGFHGELQGSNPGFFTLLAPAEKRIAAIPANFAFQSVLRKGSPEAMRRYIADNLEEIKSVLRNRLQARPTPENVMPPEGRVYDESSGGYDVLDDFFVRGREALEAGDFSLAAKCFEISSEKSKELNRATAENYQAYALLLNGETLRARMILSPLRESKCSFPSAYWNLACGMAEEQRVEQLDILAEGIRKAPHLQLLRGAVYIGVSSAQPTQPVHPSHPFHPSHPSLTQWLRCLPMIEAQLLVFYLDYGQMNSAEKETELLRIGAYVYSGEPSVPDPLDHLIPYETTGKFFQAMLERQRHAEVVDFWFRCRKRIAFMRYDFWKIRTDYFEKFGRRDQSINAFKSELHCRLRSIAAEPRFRENKMFLNATQMRAAIYLCRCMTPELRAHGRTIFRMLSRFRDNYGISLVPENLKVDRLFIDELENQPETYRRPVPARAVGADGKRTVRHIGDSRPARASYAAVPFQNEKKGAPTTAKVRCARCAPAARIN